MTKIYVLDTNVLLHDPNAIFRFEENEVVIPHVVTSELDAKKTRGDELGKNARHLNRYFGTLDKESLLNGVPLKSGGTLRFATHDESAIRSVLNPTNDDYIIATAQGLQSKLKDDEDKKVILVTRDFNMMLRARLRGVDAESYHADDLNIENISELYKGWTYIPVSDDILNQYYLLKEGALFSSAEFKSLVENVQFYPNQYVVLVPDYVELTAEYLSSLYDDVKTPVLKVRFDKQFKKNLFYLLDIQENYLREYKIFPENLHQKMALDMLFDEETKQKSLIGLAGSGKTLLALVASLIMTKKMERYDEIIITRPPVHTEYNLGYLPGDEKEKMNPFLRGFQGNLRFILNQNAKNAKNGQKKTIKTDDVKFEEHNMRPEAMSFMRGETTHRQIMIIDESQNASKHAMKTALTRIGEDSIVILLGDISQIDATIVDATNNGLSHAAELMKDETIAAHVTLEKGERSALSEMVAKKWDKPQ